MVSPNDSDAEATLALIEELCIAKCAAILREWRWGFPIDGVAIEKILAADVHVPLRNFIRYCEKRGLLKNRAGVFVPSAKLRTIKGLAETLVLAENWPDSVAVQWLCRGLDGFVSILTGSTTAPEVLFAGGDYELVSKVYTRSPIFSFFSTFTQDQVCALDGPLRILEVGGGTGATAKAIVEKASEKIEKYWCTDIAQALLTKAGAASEKLSFSRLDMNSPEDGPTELNAILALNVIHLADDPGKTLQDLSSKLIRGGKFFLGEISPPSKDEILPWIDFTFGLLPSFNRTLRDYGPLYMPERWIEHLKNARLSPVHYYPFQVGSQSYGGVYVGIRT